MNGGKGIYVGGTLISTLISLAPYLSGRRESAIFVGLSGDPDRQHTANRAPRRRWPTG